MKKIIIFAFFLFIVNTINAQTTIIDTAQYLRDSIEAKKATFSNIYFSNFLSQLKLGIKYTIVNAPLPGTPSTVSIDRIFLNFDSIEKIIENELQNKNNPGIEVIFTVPISFPKSYLEEGGVLDWTKDWNATKASFFANKIIYQVNVNGL